MKKRLVEMEIPDGYDPDEIRTPHRGDVYIDFNSKVFTSCIDFENDKFLVLKKENTTRPWERPAGGIRNLDRAATRPYNINELRSLVGIVLVYIPDGDPGLVTHTRGLCATIFGEDYSAEELQEFFTHLDGTRCEVSE